MHRASHKPQKEIRSSEKLQLVHTDICGPMQTKSFAGSRYFITFTDDYYCCCKAYFLKTKSEALEKFKEFKAAVEKESGRSIKALRADRGGRVPIRTVRPVSEETRNTSRIHSCPHSTTERSLGTNEPDVGGSCTLNDQSCRTKQCILGRSSSNCSVLA